VNESELPGLDFAAALVLLGTPFLVLALRRARRLLPARPAPGHRWKGAEVAAVIATPFVLVALLGPVLSTDNMLGGLIVNELLFGLCAGLAIALAARREQGLARLGLVAPEARSFLAVPLVYAPWFFPAYGLVVAWMHLCRALGWPEQQDVMRRVLELEGPALVAATGIAVLVGPLLEELLFRGFLQSVLAQVLGERGGLVLSSALFAALHGVPGLPMLFSLSLFFGWLQRRTRCIWVPYAAHALHNGIMLALALQVSRG
jgi:membrane protease YdiL (CAAX protease family)